MILAENAKATPKLFKGIADPDGLRKASEIDREVVSGFREKLLETPKFYDKDRRLRDLPFLDRLTDLTPRIYWTAPRRRRWKGPTKPRPRFRV